MKYIPFLVNLAEIIGKSDRTILYTSVVEILSVELQLYTSIRIHESGTCLRIISLKVTSNCSMILNIPHLLSLLGHLIALISTDRSAREGIVSFPAILFQPRGCSSIEL